MMHYLGGEARKVADKYFYRWRLLNPNCWKVFSQKVQDVFVFNERKFWKEIDNDGEMYHITYIAL
jgi:hypothetical protein